MSGKPLLLPAFLLFCISLTAQLTIHVTSVPAGTPANAEIYIAGNFNTWNPGDAAYKLTNNNNGTYNITFSPATGELEFKFTKGSWATVEGNAGGGFIPNRTYNYSGGAQTLNLSIAGWEGSSGSGDHTAEPNVQIMDEEFYIPQLDRTRRIWLYLPPDYQTTAKHYPVLYLQDGQNVFDEYYSFSGEWEVDESMNDLFDNGDYGAIVVGIDNGGTYRLDEYSAWYNPQYGGGQGELYAEFLVNTLKPYIDSHYRTLPGREYTGIGGSSMGANISMYTAVEYQDVFSKVGIFSPAFWFSDSCYLHLENAGFEHDLRVYFVAGENESASMVPKMMDMYNTLVAEGFDEEELYFITHPDGAHSEWYWAREYPDAYEWLFGDLILETFTPGGGQLYVYPNPADSVLRVESAQTGLQVKIFSPMGRLMHSQALKNTRDIDVSGLSGGIYFLEIKNGKNQTLSVSRFVKE